MESNGDPRVVVGNRRAAFRVALGLTQQQLSESAGVSLKTIENAENGEPMREPTIRAIAAALGVAAKEYFEPEAYAASSAPVPAPASAQP